MHTHTNTCTRKLTVSFICILFLLSFCFCSSLCVSLYLTACDLFYMGWNAYMLKLNEKQYWTECYCAVCVCALHWMDASLFICCNSFFSSSLVGISLKCDAFLYPLFFVCLFFVCATLLCISSGNESSREKKHSWAIITLAQKLDGILISIHHFLHQNSANACSNCRNVESNWAVS